jgi:hypothetical protein
VNTMLSCPLLSSSIQEGLFFNKSRQATQTPGESVQMVFNGTAIWYFSDTGANYGNVRIRLDGDDTGEIASGYSSSPVSTLCSPPSFKLMACLTGS